MKNSEKIEDFKKRILEKYRKDGVFMPKKYDWEKPYKGYDHYEDEEKSDLRRKVDELVERMRAEEARNRARITIDDIHKNFTTKELLDSIDIEEIDTYVRTKKLQRIQKNMKK